MDQLFDADKKIKYYAQADKGEYMYTFLYLGKLIADIEFLKKSGEDTNQLTRRLKYIKGRKALLKTEVTEWLQSVNIERRRGLNSIDDLVDIADRIATVYRVRIYTRVPPQRIYSLLHDIGKESERVINLAYFDSNINVFKPCFTTTNRSVCKLCSETYQHLSRHRCTAICLKCSQTGCDAMANPENDQIRRQCADCNFVFRTEMCYAGHLRPKRECIKNRGKQVKSKCQSVKRCLQCSQIYTTEKNEAHDCNRTKWCNTCNKRVNAEFHDCCWPKISDATKRRDLEKQQNYKIVFFDFESVVVNDQDEYIQQYANLACYTSLCNECLDLDPYTDECQKCGTSRSGEFLKKPTDSQHTIVDKFIDILLFDQRFNNCFALAHFGSRYDHVFVLERLLHRGIQPHVITRGSTIIVMNVEGIKGVRNHITFKDSFMYLPVSLKLLPTMFALEGEKKGTFPFYYNKESNYGSSLDHLPDKSYYKPEFMTAEARQKFDEWYDENYHTKWVFNDQIVEYCKNDCYILHLAMAKFIKMSMSLYNLQPVVHVATMPSFVFKVLRNTYENDQIQIIPELGYRKDNQSLIAVQYIQWVEHTTQESFQYSLCGGEYPVVVNGRQYKVDAIEKTSRRILEVFSLCRSCAEEFNNDSCPHESISDRILYVVVYSAELQLSMENGYRCLHIYESYNWLRWGNIFKDFLVPLQKIKTEASGWPSENMTDEEKDAYIKLVFEHEGIKLDKNNMKLNKAMRQLVKIMSNASYGKLGQRVDRSQVEFIPLDSPTFADFFMNEHITILTQRVIGKFLMVSYKQNSELLETCPYSSVAYAAIITSLARIKLWHALNKVGDATIYFDTDSIYAIAKPGQVILEADRGSFLGKWEVDHDSNYILFDWVCIASKVYAYRMKNIHNGEVKEIVKAKGVTLNCSNNRLVNFDSMVHLLDEFTHNKKTEYITTGGPQITKTRDAQIFTTEPQKKLKVVMDKTRCLPNYKTRPFGFLDT